MKVFILALFVAIALGGLVGTLLVRDPGYVLVAYADTVLETSLWVALLLLIAVYLVVRLISFAIRKGIQGQGRMMRWRSGRKVRAARLQTVRGLLVMAEGRWADAQKLLVGVAEDVDTPLINYLNAARAAHELGQIAERDGYLKRAHETTAGAKFAVTLTQAEFYIDDGQYEQALASLLILRKRAPKHGAVLAMLARCFEALGDWDALAQMMADLRKSKALSETEYATLERNLWSNLLNAAQPADNGWKKLPKALRTDEQLTTQWVQHLMAANRDDDAEYAIRRVLGVRWYSQLALWYGQLTTSDPSRQLVVAQNWFKERPNDANVALTAGRLSLRVEKFEQARDYFESSLRIHPSDEVYAELGRLLVALGDEHRGTEYLLKAQGHLPDLPQPAQPLIRKASVS